MGLIDQLRRGYRPTTREKILNCGSEDELNGFVAEMSARERELTPAESNAVALRRAQLKDGK